MQNKLSKEIRKIVKFIKEKPNYSYHYAWCVLGILGGILLTFIYCINEVGVSKGIFIALATLVMGTLCFFMLPLAFITATIFIRFAPTFTILVYIVLLIGKMSGEINIIDEYGYVNSLIFSLLMSAFGLFNIITAFRGREENKSDEDMVTWPIV